MASPGTATDPSNPYKSVVGATYAGGRTNAINALQNPEDAARKRTKSLMLAQMGMGPQYTNEQLYGNVATPSYGFGGQGRSQQMAGSQSPTPEYSNGVLPARAGRLGYRGQLQDTGTPIGQGLDWLSQGANQAALNQGAQQETDPVTGLSMNPTNSQINSQLQMIAGQGDESELEGQGVGGSRRSQALARYYEARASGNPQAIAATTGEVQGLKNTIKALRPQPSQTTAIAPETMGQSVPAPYGVGADEESGVKDAMGALPKAKGGDVSEVHPYIVNEQGPESVLYDGEKNPQLIPGGEHMTTFPKDGKVIPHGRTMRMMQQGKIMEPQHRADGGKVSNSRLAKFGRQFTRGLADYSGLNALRGAKNWLTEEPQPYSPADLKLPENYGPSAPADLLRPDNYGPTAKPYTPPIQALAPYDPGRFDNSIRNRQSKDGILFHPNQVQGLQNGSVAEPFTGPHPAWNRESGYIEPPMRDAFRSNGSSKIPSSVFYPGGGGEVGNEPVPSPSAPPDSEWLQNLLSQIAVNAAPTPIAPTPQPMAPVSQAMMGNRGVDMTERTPNSASFLTPYGSASVTHGAPTPGPHVFNADGTAWNGQPAPVARPTTNEMAARTAYADNQMQQKLYPETSNPQLMGRVARNQALVDKFAADDESAIGRSLAPARKMGGKVSRTRMMMRGMK